MLLPGQQHSLQDFLEGSRTAYGLACDSTKVKAWYVAPNVTGCLEGVHLWKDLHLYELERLYKRTSVIKIMFYLELLTLLECLCP